jgi:bacterioferritin
VIDILNDALRHELTAVNQYWVHYRLLDGLAKKEREGAIEEMRHDDKLIERIVFLEGHPNLQKIDPLKIGQDIKEVLDADLQAEHGARTLYIKARMICQKAEDYVSMELFDELLVDEEAHIDFIKTQLALLDKIGAGNYGLLQAASADEAKGGAT